ARVIAAKRIAGVDSLPLRIAHDLVRIPSDAHGKLLERCPFRKHELEPEALPRIGGEAHAGLPHFTQSLRSQPREVDEAGKGQQRLVRRDVRRRLLAADVLLAGLQGEDIAALARGVYRLADDPAR